MKDSYPSKDFYFLNLLDPYSASQPITSDCEAEPISAPMSGIKRKKPSWPSVLARPLDPSGPRHDCFAEGITLPRYFHFVCSFV